MKKLVLFDIDGILVKSVSMGVTALLMRKHFGVEPVKNEHYHEGKTYRLILKERLIESGIEDPENDERFYNALADASVISDKLKEGRNLEKIPFTEELIKSLVQKGHAVGLLTGNTRESAKVKLEHVGLWKYFGFGAFGHESDVRADLVPLAMEDAKKKLGIGFDKKDVFLIGDTRQDIACAKTGGVNIISIATGRESVEQLTAEGSDFVFKDCSEIEKILEIIEG